MHPDYCDCEGKPSSHIQFLEITILANLKDFIMEQINTEFSSLIFSSIIDVLIDTGVLIPTIVHHRYNNTVVRAYKGGEVCALNEEHFKLFTYTLNKYLNYLEHDILGKIEFEKLCVMFFSTAVKEKILGISRKTDMDDEYSICYSKFGPRVSTSKRKYEARESSSLASKLLSISYIDRDKVKIGTSKADVTIDNSVDTVHSDNLLQVVEEYEVNDKYKIKNTLKDEEITDKYWANVSNRFVRRFSRIYKHLFDNKTGEIIFDEVRNMFLYSYPELLTLMAIGLNKKEQLLSLLAEVHLFNEKKLVGDIEYILIKHHEILDGLLSGMWKYMCFSQQFKEETKRFKPMHPVEKLIEKLERRDDETSIYVQDFIEEFIDLNRNIDLNQHIEPLLHKA